MNRENVNRWPWLRWAGFAAFWTLLGLAFGTQLYAMAAARGRSPEWGHAITLGLRDWYLWALLWPLIRRLADRFGFERGTVGRDALVHLGVGLVAVLVYEGLSLLTTELLVSLMGADLFGRPPAGQTGEKPATGFGRFEAALTFRFSFDLLTYFVLVSANLVMVYTRRFRERERSTLELKTRLTEARLQALRMQLNPHFLFNALNSLATLVHKDPQAADEMIGSISELLRLTLSQPERQEVTLAEEMMFLDRYLEIEQARFGDRLKVEQAVAADTLAGFVPILILQPLVENAIKHGIEARLAPGVIRIAAEHAGDELILRVGDNGPGLPATAAVGRPEGVGLANTRARLAELYGERARLTLRTATEGGLLAEVCLPWKAGIVPGLGETGARDT